jgi:hypothetical protein
MANAILFYRTASPNTRKDNVTYTDPQNLPTPQKLEFNFPDDILEGVSESYNNNIKTIAVPNQDGVRKLNIQENGLNNNVFTINGVFSKDVNAGIQKLKAIRKIKQVDTYHLFGRFGIEIDNAPEYNIDPIDSFGLHIMSTTIGYAGIKTTRYDFQVSLGFGGTIP